MRLAPDFAVSCPLDGVRLWGALNWLVGGREELPVHIPVLRHGAADLGEVPHPQRVVWVY